MAFDTMVTFRELLTPPDAQVSAYNHYGAKYSYNIPPGLSEVTVVTPVCGIIKAHKFLMSYLTKKYYAIARTEIPRGKAPATLLFTRGIEAFYQDLLDRKVEVKSLRYRLAMNLINDTLDETTKDLLGALSSADGSLNLAENLAELDTSSLVDDLQHIVSLTSTFDEGINGAAEKYASACYNGDLEDYYNKYWGYIKDVTHIGEKDTAGLMNTILEFSDKDLPDWESTVARPVMAMLTPPLARHDINYDYRTCYLLQHGDCLNTDQFDEFVKLYHTPASRDDLWREPDPMDSVTWSESITEFSAELGDALVAYLSHKGARARELRDLVLRDNPKKGVIEFKDNGTQLVFKHSKKEATIIEPILFYLAAPNLVINDCKE